MHDDELSLGGEGIHGPEHLSKPARKYYAASATGVTVEVRHAVTMMCIVAYFIEARFRILMANYPVSLIPLKP